MTGNRKSATTAHLLLMAAFLAAMAAFARYAHVLFLKYPPVWPDETLFANPAINLVQRGVLATDLFSGIIPGVTRCTFLQPPLYYLYLWAVFSLAGVSIYALRLASLLAATGVMALTYSLGVRSGLSRWLAVVPATLLAVDTAFLRGSLLGRMDMLALALILCALWLHAGPSASLETPGRKKLFITGLVCGLAALTHPMGFAAPTAVVGTRALAPHGPRRQVLTPLLAGVLLPFLFWAAYIARHWQSFLAQFGGQILTKAGREPLTLHHLLLTFRLYVEQYGVAKYPVIVVWLAGIIGLGLAARRRRRPALALLVCQLLMMAVMAWGKEMWYVLYLAPLTMIGLAHLIALAGERKVLARAGGSLAILLAFWFAQQSLLNTEVVRRMNVASGKDYSGWCREISNAIPRGSKVLLSAIPDPYFGLRGRSDLTFRQFVPEGFPVDPKRYSRWLAQPDFIIVGGPIPSLEVWKFVQKRGKLVKRIGVPHGNGYYTEIYAVLK